MSNISEQEPNNTIGELSKALSSEVGKAERVSKHCSKIDTTTTPAEKEERSVNKSSSCEINGEDNLKTTIRNFSKQIQELQQERLSTSFQHRRFYSNPNPLRLENGLPKYYHHSHSQSTKRLRSQVYTKKNKNYSNICSLLMILRYLHMNLRQMKNTAIFRTKEYIFWLQTAEKVSTTLINLTGNIKS